MEEVCGKRVSREGEVPSGMEKQEFFTEAVYDESSEARQNDIRCEVRIVFVACQKTTHMHLENLKMVLGQ